MPETREPAAPVQPAIRTRPDRLLPNAGGLLMAAGGIAAFTGGAYGLAETRPGLIVFSVMLLMGYGVVGYLLMNRGARYFHVALPGTALLVVATLGLFQAEMGRMLAQPEFRFVLEPALALILAFAAGALLTHVVEEATTRYRWPSKGASSLNTLLHLSAYAPVWSAFTLLALVRDPTPAFSLLVVGGSVLVAIACVVGGYAASRGSHPAFTVVGAALGFLASVAYLFQFMLGGGSADARVFGQFNALLGLILTGLPLAIGAVAWIQASNETPVDEVEGQPQ